MLSTRRPPKPVSDRIFSAVTFAAIASIGGAVSIANAQTVTPEFADNYVLVDLGPVSTVPSNYGAIMFKPGDANTLYIGGAANSSLSKIYAVPLTRDGNGFITGFGAAPPVIVCSTPGSFGGIDGGVDIFNGVLLYTTYSDNYLGEIKPGSTAPDRLISLTPLGVGSSTGTLRIVPPGFPGAGRLKIVSYSQSNWHDSTMSMAPDGTVDINVNPNPIFINGGPEGVIYVAAGNPEFTQPSILVSRYGFGEITAYEVDGNGDPIVSTVRPVVISLGGAEGAVQDPVTGDFLFSTFGGGSRLVIVRGFNTPCPADLNNDGLVDGADLAFVLGNWNLPGVGDLNQDGVANGADIAIILGAWGDCPYARRECV